MLVGPFSILYLNEATQPPLPPRPLSLLFSDCQMSQEDVLPAFNFFLASDLGLGSTLGEHHIGIPHEEGIVFLW